MGRATHLLVIACCLSLELGLLASLASCDFPGSVRPTRKIGLVAPFEGRYRYIGYDAIYAVRLAVQQANDDGGVGGYGVELVAYDDGANPAMAIEQARKLVVDPDVVAVMGHFRDATTSAAVDTYAGAGLPLLVPTDLRGEIGGSEAVHALGPSSDQLASLLLDTGADMAGGDPVVLVGDGGPLSEALRRAAGRRDLRLFAVSHKADGWRRAVMGHGASVLLCDLDPVTAGEVVAALRDVGWEGHVLGGPALAMSDFVAVAGASAAGATFLTPWPFPRDVPGGEAFLAAYGDVSNGTMPGPLALPAYEGTRTLLDALAQAASEGIPSRDRVSAALTALEREGPSRQGDGSARRLTLDEADGPLDGTLAWYRIGSDGIPRLIERNASSSRQFELTTDERRP